MDIQVYKGKPVMTQALGNLEGLIRVDLPENPGPLRMTWKGPKISAAVWAQIKSFFKFTYDDYKGESQLRLYMNQETGEWKAIVLPQYKRSGLHTQELETHALRDHVFSQVPSEKGWKAAGSVHHHCSAGAFQSGTDANDEKSKHGLHITLGHLDQPTWAEHARFTFREVPYEVDLNEWVEGERLVAPVELVFPDDWKCSLIEPPPPPVYTTPVWGTSFGSSYTPGDTGYWKQRGQGSKEWMPNRNSIGFDNGGYSWWDENDAEDALEAMDAGKNVDLSSHPGALVFEAFTQFVDKDWFLKLTSHQVSTLIDSLEVCRDMLKEVEKDTGFEPLSIVRIANEMLLKKFEMTASDNFDLDEYMEILEVQRQREVIAPTGKTETQLEQEKYDALSSAYRRERDQALMDGP